MLAKLLSIVETSNGWLFRTYVSLAQLHTEPMENVRHIPMNAGEIPCFMLHIDPNRDAAVMTRNQMDTRAQTSTSEHFPSIFWTFKDCIAPLHYNGFHRNWDTLEEEIDSCPTRATAGYKEGTCQDILAKIFEWEDTNQPNIQHTQKFSPWRSTNSESPVQLYVFIFYSITVGECK